MCHFVLRQRLDRGTEEDRAVYRYVFTCPGEAVVLVRAPPLPQDPDIHRPRTVHVFIVVMTFVSSGGASPIRPTP